MSLSVSASLAQSVRLARYAVSSCCAFSASSLSPGLSGSCFSRSNTPNICPRRTSFSTSVSRSSRSSQHSTLAGMPSAGGGGGGGGCKGDAAGSACKGGEAGRGLRPFLRPGRRSRVSRAHSASFSSNMSAAAAYRRGRSCGCSRHRHKYSSRHTSAAACSGRSGRARRRGMPSRSTKASKNSSGGAANSASSTPSPQAAAVSSSHRKIVSEICTIFFPVAKFCAAAAAAVCFSIQ